VRRGLTLKLSGSKVPFSQLKYHNSFRSNDLPCPDCFSIFNFGDRLKNHLFKFVRGDRLFSNDLLLEGDRLNNHFLKFVRGDRYSTH
jgi:hypothetical protein